MQVTRGLQWLFGTLIALICAALILFLALLACNHCVLSSVYRHVSEDEVFPFNGIALHELADEYSSPGAKLLSPNVVRWFSLHRVLCIWHARSDRPQFRDLVPACWSASFGCQEISHTLCVQPLLMLE